MRNDDPAQLANITQFLHMLESKDISLYYCRLCECILSDGSFEQTKDSLIEK